MLWIILACGLFYGGVLGASWVPLSGRGDPLRNDPTFDYEPPPQRSVHYWESPDQRTERAEKQELLVLGVTARRPLPPGPALVPPPPPPPHDWHIRYSNTHSTNTPQTFPFSYNEISYNDKDFSTDYPFSFNDDAGFSPTSTELAPTPHPFLPTVPSTPIPMTTTLSPLMLNTMETNSPTLSNHSIMTNIQNASPNPHSASNMKQFSINLSPSMHHVHHHHLAPQSSHSSMPFSPLHSHSTSHSHIKSHTHPHRLPFSHHSSNMVNGPPPSSSGTIPPMLSSHSSPRLPTSEMSTSRPSFHKFSPMPDTIAKIPEPISLPSHMFQLMKTTSTISPPTVASPQAGQSSIESSNSILDSPFLIIQGHSKVKTYGVHA